MKCIWQRRIARHGRRHLWAMSAWLTVGLWTSLASADVIRLKQGGELRGSISEDRGGKPGGGEIVEMRTLTGALVRVPRADVEYAQRRSPTVEEYVTRSRRTPHTIEARWDLAQWCREQRLAEQRSEQLELLLDLDPNHLEARRVLGFVQHNGKWKTRDEIMEERGYVKHQGKWVTRQELEVIEVNSARKDAEMAWFPRVRLWLSWAQGANAAQQAQGLRSLDEIRDPDAVAALSTCLGRSSSVDTRLLFVRLLSRIEGDRPVRPLVELGLHDGEPEVSRQALAALGPERIAAALPYLIKALKHESNQVVRRAAKVLGESNDLRAVPPLIEALVTTHRIQVTTPVASGMTFARGPQGQVGMLPSGQTGALPVDIEAMSRAGQLPYGYNVIPPPGQLQRTVTVSVRQEFKNEEVLQALWRLTGQNFGYLQRDWQLWWTVHHT